MSGVSRPLQLASQTFSDAGDLTNLILLQCTSRPEAWHEWFEEQGISTENSYHGPRFDTFSMCIRAAQVGCGVALVPRFLVQDELEEEKLVIPWEHHKPSMGSHFIAFSETAADVPKVKSLVDWIIERAKGQKLGIQ